MSIISLSNIDIVFDLKNDKQIYDWKGVYDSFFPLLASIHARP